MKEEGGIFEFTFSEVNQSEEMTRSNNISMEIGFCNGVKGKDFDA